ncbi:MAG: DUF3871 family protein [Bacteroidota bacterium]
MLEHEKTIYFERMAFIIEMPIKKKLFGQELNLTIAGVKAYNQDNLYSNSSNSLQSFKVAIGFKVKVCTNLCIFTDGANLNLKAHSIEDLQTQIKQLFLLYSDTAQLEALQTFGDYTLSEIQFATILEKTRLYNFLPRDTKKDIPEFIISDTQVNAAAKQYYKDEYFRRNKDGSINLWNVYNLLTDGVKNSYIDTFLDRNLNTFEFTQGIAKALEGESEYGWFLN